MKILGESGRSIVVIGMLLATIMVTYGISIPIAEAASAYYHEDFSTTTYLDDMNTTAQGWGSGSLSLGYKEPILVGTCDTPGYARDLCIQGDLAYVADQGGGVQIIDIHDPTQPEIIGAYDAISGTYRVDVVGEIAYVADYWDRLQVLNISDPTNPNQIGSYAPSGYGYEVVIDGDLAFIGWGGMSPEASFRILNITDPRSPSTLGYYNDFNTYPQIIRVDGDFAYLGCGQYGMRVMDITDPHNPTVLDVVVPGISYAFGLAVEGNVVYVGAGSGSFRVVDVSDPSNAVLIGSAWTGYTRGVCVDGNQVYTASTTAGVSVVDVTNPKNPVRLWYNQTPGNAWDVEVVGEYLYVADGPAGLLIYKIADLIEPEFRGEFLAGASALSVEGNTAYIIDYSDDEFRIVNITDVTHPQSLSNYTDLYAPIEVCIEGDYAFIIDQWRGLEIIDVSNPRNPTRAGGYVPTPQDWHYTGLAVEGNFVYLADPFEGLSVVNITDPTNPELIGDYLPGSNLLKIAVQGNWAFASDAYGLFHVVNITNPTQPSIVGTCWNFASFGSFQVVGNYAYLVSQDRMSIINVTKPSSPAIIGWVTLPDWSFSLDVVDKRAYIADRYYGLQVVDISNVTEPVIMDSYATPRSAVGISVSGEYAFIADESSLQILEVKSSRLRQYRNSSIAQSTGVLSIDGNPVQIYVTITVLQVLPSGTSAKYYLSADDGANWKVVSPGIIQIFSKVGNSIRWRANITTSDTYVSPNLFELTISAIFAISPPVPESPLDGSSTNDTTPLLEWSSIIGAVGYLIQLDTSPYFNTSNLHAAIVEDTTAYTPAISLLEGTWYWRVAANDSEGHLGVFSVIWSFTIDTELPPAPILLTPENDSIQTNNTHLFAWTHVTDSSSYIIQIDTSSSFDSGNLQTVAGLVDSFYSPEAPLTDGTYFWRVCAIDLAQNHGPYSQYWTVSFDTTQPIWNEIIDDNEVELGTDVRFDLGASDPSGIHSYQVNDTARFGIFANGTVFNQGLVPVGEYGLSVTVTDLAGHTSNAAFQITVIDTTAPTWVFSIESIELEYNQGFQIDLLAVDLSGIDHYTVSDTARFAIDSEGALTNATLLDPGTYTVTVAAYDPYRNFVEISIAFTVAEPDAGIPPPDFTMAIVGAGLGAGALAVVVVIFLKRKS